MKKVKLGEVLKPKFIPLTFISLESEIKEQIKNTIILNKVLKNNNNKISMIDKLIENTQYGYTASANSTGKYKLLRITDIKNRIVDWDSVPFCECDSPEKYLLKKNDILIARTGGTTGKSFLITKEPPQSLFASYLIRIRVSKNLLPEYLYIFLNSYYYWFQVSEMKKGTAQPNVNAEKLKELLIPYCDIETQKLIIENRESFLDNQILGRYDKIQTLDSLLTSQLELIKKYKQAILQDAIQGKLVPQNKKDEPASVLLEKIKKTKPQGTREKKLEPIKPEEIPFEIPKNWVWCRLGEVYKSNGQKIPDSKFSYIDVTAINKEFGYINDKDIKVLEAIDAPSRARKIVSKGNIIYSTVRPYLLNISIIEKDYNPEPIVSTAFIVLDPLLNIDSKYIFYYLRSNSFIKYVESKMVGMAYPAINDEHFKNGLLPLPPVEEQKRIVARVDQLMSYCDSIESKLMEDKQLSEHLVESILQEAFSN